MAKWVTLFPQYYNNYGKEVQELILSLVFHATLRVP